MKRQRSDAYPARVKRKRLSFFWKIVYLFSLLTGFSLFISWIVSFINPLKNSLFSVAGLLFFHLYLATASITIIWLLKKAKRSIIFFLILLLTYPTFRAYLPIRLHSPVELRSHSSQFRCITYNVCSFNTFYYNESRAYLDSLTAFLNTLEPDIVCFQEYYNDREFEQSITKILSTQLKMPHYYIHPRLIRYDRYEFGLAIFSKYPIVYTGKIDNINYTNETYSTNYSIYADIVHRNDTVRVYNIHLESFKVSEDEEFIGLVYEGSVQNLLEQSPRILRKLRKAYEFRARQVVDIIEHIKKSPYPVIIMGDLNDLVCSWTYRQFSKLANDTHVKAGKGLANTYVSPYFSTRIDYIFVDSRFHVLESKSICAPYSDHYPVYAHVQMRAE